MKIIFRILIFTSAWFLFACSDTKPRNFFAASGIAVGIPALVEPNVYRIPIIFETEITHSGQWTDAVQAEIDGTDIQVTAVFTHANRESQYPGYIELSNVSSGVYNLKYRDPDGTLHLIQKISLP